MPAIETLPEVFTEAEPCRTQSAHCADYEQLSRRWREIFPLLIDAELEQYAPSTSNCGICEKELSTELIKCEDCSATAYYCSDCYHKTHKQIMFHKPIIWSVSVVLLCTRLYFIALDIF